MGGRNDFVFVCGLWSSGDIRGTRPGFLWYSRGGTSSKFRGSVEVWMASFLRHVPGSGREDISVMLGVVRVSSSSLIGLGVFCLQVGVVQRHRDGKIFYLRVRWWWSRVRWRSNKGVLIELFICQIFLLFFRKTRKAVKTGIEDKVFGTLRIPMIFQIFCALLHFQCLERKCFTLCLISKFGNVYVFPAFPVILRKERGKPGKTLFDQNALTAQIIATLPWVPRDPVRYPMKYFSVKIPHGIFHGDQPSMGPSSAYVG